MKNRITKMLTFVLAGLLLIGCLAGITAFAEDATAPTAEIVAKNVSYKGAMQILYAVDYDGVTEGQSVKLYFYDTKDATEPAYKKGLDADDTITLNDTTYSLVFSNGITPKDMRKPIYAKPVVENEDGSLAYEGEMLEYSIWQYAINRFSKSPSTEQYALYTALLDYGGALQRTLLGSSYTEEELALAGGYADEYYIIEVQKMLGVCPEGEPEFAASLSPDELIAGFNPADVVEMPKTYNELVFCGFTLEDGTPVGAFGADKTAISHSTLLVSKELIEIAKPGKHTILANYTNDYELVDFAGGDTGNATLGTNHSIPEGEEYVYVNKPAKGSGSLKLTPHNKNGDVYFFEADVTWNGYTADTTHAEWFLKLTFNSTASQDAGGSDYSLHRTFFRIDADGNMGINGDNSLGTASAPAATLAVGESVNLRIEYEPKGVNAEGKYLHDVRMYIIPKRRRKELF